MLATYTDGTVTQENLYTGEGQRIQKKEGNDVTNYFYQEGSVLYTTDASGSLKAFNLLNISDAFGTERKSGTSETYYLYTEDLKGSTVNVLDNSEAAVVSYWYDDFGEVTESKASGYSSFDNELQYTGAVYDASTGLLYLNARFYDPQTGRFISRDTYRGERDKASTWHLYMYCKNNPIIYTDLTGHDPVKTVLKLADYRRIHGKVADMYCSWLGLNLKKSREVYVKNKKGKRGFLDVYNYKNNTYYEVKSEKAGYKKSTADQMKRYDNSIVQRNGKKPKRGKAKYDGIFYYGIWQVNYQAAFNVQKGLVTYTTKVSKQAKELFKAVAMGGLAAGGFYVFGPGGALIFI